MDWTTVLRSQQADFIKRLKSGCLLHCETEGQHSELRVVSGERLDKLRDFCWEMAEKYKRSSSVRDVFLNNLKGKLGEGVVKARLADLVTEVDYEKRFGGDGKVDFTLTSDPNLGIQVKARHSSIDSLQWSISSEEVEKNVALVCILIQEKVSEAQAEYNLILAGFLPTKMIDASSGKASVGIDELLYAGGLCSYLGSLNSSETDRLIQPEIQPSKPQQQQNPTSNTIKDKPIKRKLVSSETNGSRQPEIQPSKPQQECKPVATPIRDKPIKRKLVSDIPNYINLCEGKLSTLEDYNQAIKINPTDATAYYNRGHAHSKLKDKRAALEDFQRAADLFQQQGEQGNYQKALERIGRFDIVAD